MPTKRTRAQADAALADALYAAMPMVVAHVNGRLADHDMTYTDLWALRAIDGPMPMKELAHCMDYDPSYVTVIADRLEKLALIERQPHPTDRRVKNLVCTAKGDEFKTTMAEMVWSCPNTFSPLTAAERAQLAKLLTKLSSAPVGDDD